MNQQFENMAKYLNQLQGGWPYDQKNVQITYRSLPASITADLWGYGYLAARAGRGRMMVSGEPYWAAGAAMAALRHGCRWTRPQGRAHGDERAKRAGDAGDGSREYADAEQQRQERRRRRSRRPAAASPDRAPI